MTYPKQTVSYRTGVLIGESIVLTVGHNLYEPRNNPNSPSEALGSLENIDFYPGLIKNKSILKDALERNFIFQKIIQKLIEMILV